MKILVCIKQVPESNKVEVDPVTGVLKRDGAASKMNPYDLYALETAFRIREQTGGTVQVISMGPPQADVALREALAMGCDDALLISDRAFGGADTWATSSTIAAALKKLDYDVIITGRQAIDGDTAQVGPQIGQRLGVPVVTYVQDYKVEGDKVIVQRQLEDGYEVIEVGMPCLLTAVKELNTPRYMSIGGIVDAYQKEITVWDHVAVDLDPADCGLKASPTRVFRSFTPPQKGKGEMLEGSIQEMGAKLVGKLVEKHYI